MLFFYFLTIHFWSKRFCIINIHLSAKSFLNIIKLAIYRSAKKEKKCVRNFKTVYVKL